MSNAPAQSPAETEVYPPSLELQRHVAKLAERIAQLEALIAEPELRPSSLCEGQCPAMSRRRAPA